MLGSRAIWEDGWAAVVWHEKDKSFDEDKWELYHTDVDFSQAHDLAAEMPDKLKDSRPLSTRRLRRLAFIP